MPQSYYDVIVIGAGPAGASAAITARAAGFNVLLLERGLFPRHKVCGEFVSAESLDLLHNLLGPQQDFLLRDAVSIDCTRIFLDGRQIDTQIAPAAASIPRFDLDAALWASAKNRGVDAREKVIVERVSRNGHFHVSTSGETFKSLSVIDATGRWSNLNAKSAGLPAGTNRWIGLKGHFQESTQISPSVDLYFFDGGYCGVQPVNLRDRKEAGRVNACAMIRADVANNLPEVFEQTPLLRHRSHDWKPLSDPVSTSPLIFKNPQPERDGVLMAGDAAVFVDPFIGDGISLAMRGGALAASSLVPFLRQEISHVEAINNYRNAYQRTLAPVFTASSIVRRALQLPRAIRIPMFYLVKTVPGLSKYLVRRTR